MQQRTQSQARPSELQPCVQMLLVRLELLHLFAQQCPVPSQDLIQFYDQQESRVRVLLEDLRGKAMPLRQGMMLGCGTCLLVCVMLFAWLCLHGHRLRLRLRRAEEKGKPLQDYLLGGGSLARMASETYLSMEDVVLNLMQLEAEVERSTLSATEAALILCQPPGGELEDEEEELR